MQRIFIISDTHLGHDKMVEYCGRPENHSELILDNLFKNLKDGDTLIHLGDFCIGNDEEWHNKFWAHLPGYVKTVLAKGNHDRQSNSWYLNHGWDFVCEQFQDVYFGKRIVFSHKPVPNGDWDYNLHGHFHNNQHRSEPELLKIYTKKHKLFSIEDTKYKPVLLDTIIKKQNEERN
jgi:calcineurin-like phosphoesterase family protein